MKPVKWMLTTALASALIMPAMADRPAAKNVILMVSDGIGFNGWLAADYYEGKAGQQSYQITRPDGTEPRVYGLAHSALNLIDADGNVLPSGSDIAEASGAVEQGYDPTSRWERFENTMLNDFAPMGESYTTYTDSAAAGTALMTGRKTANGRINLDWSGEHEFQTIAQIAMAEDRAAGSIASVMISHATPAAAIAHNVSRNNYAEIFNEMAASDLDVIMGAGHPLYDNSGSAFTPEEDSAYQFVGGQETLAALTSEEGLNGFAFVDAKSDFEALASGEDLPQKVIGVARAGATLQALREDLSDADTPSGMAKNEAVPDLATMTLGALLYSGLIRLATDPERGTDGMKVIQHIAGVLVETYLVFDEPDQAMDASLKELSELLGCKPWNGKLPAGALPPAHILDNETERGRMAARLFFEEWLDCAFEFHHLMLVIIHNILVSWEAEGLPRQDSLRLLVECTHKAMGFELAAQ